jgi:hypothetical protein
LICVPEGFHLSLNDGVLFRCRFEAVVNRAVFLFSHHALLSFALHGGIHHQDISRINFIAVPACLLALLPPFDSVFGGILAVFPP